MGPSPGRGEGVRQAAPLIRAATLMITQSGCNLWPPLLEEREGGAGQDDGRNGGFKCAVFTSIRQARWRFPSKPISSVVFGRSERDRQAGSQRGPVETTQACPWSRPVTSMRKLSKPLLHTYSLWLCAFRASMLATSSTAFLQHVSINHNLCFVLHACLPLYLYFSQ